MKKSEIKDGINRIVKAINVARENIDEYLEPYFQVQEHLDALEELEVEYGIDTGISFADVLSETLRNCVEGNSYTEDITNMFDELIADLECWQEDVSETKSEKIQEDYINILNEIKDGFDIYAMEDKNDVDDQLFDLSNALEDIII